MSGWLIGLIVAAVGFAGLGLQMLSLQINRFPGDIRRPGPLIDIRRSKPDVAHSTELRRLVTVMSYAIINDESAGQELAKVFDELDGPTSPLLEGNGSRRDHNRRAARIEQAIVDLERKWGIVDQPPPDRPSPPYSQNGPSEAPRV